MNKSDKRDKALEAYSAGNPIMSDEEYDALELEIGDQKVGDKLSGLLPAVKHKFPMGTFIKAQTLAEVSKWLSDCLSAIRQRNIYPLVFTDKMDGVSVSANYVDGILVNALTRGDCFFGEDITPNFRLMKQVLLKLPVKFTGSLIGEIVVRKSDFHNFPGAANPRNSAAGAAKATNDRSKAKYCSVFFYKVAPRLSSRLEDFKFLKSIGLVTPSFTYAKAFDGIKSIYDRYINERRDILDYIIDGLVVEVDSTELAYEIGSDPLVPEYAIAFKFPAAKAETTLKYVVWQTGRTGVVTPVAHFDAVLLAGASVAKANIATVDLMIEKNLTPGARIIVSRRNDVIPMVEESVSPGNGKFNIPDNCPSCGAKLSRIKKRLYCTSSITCPAQIELAIVNYTTKIGVLEWGEEAVKAVCESADVQSIFDIYYLDPDEISDVTTSSGKVIGDKTAETMIRNLHQKSSLSLPTFIGALGIPGIGKTLAESLVENGYDTFNKMKDADPDDISEIDGFGPTRAPVFCSTIRKLSKGVFTLIADGKITIEERTSGHLDGISVCMTGFRDSDMAAEIESLGGTVKSSVSKGLTYLVQKSAEKSSSKSEGAKKLGVKVISQEQMWNLIRRK